MASLVATESRNWRTKSIEDALLGGIFLEFDLGDNTLKESAIHQLLQVILDDLQDLQNIEEATVESAKNIQLNATTETLRQCNSIVVSASDLTYLFAFYNRLENVFNGHLALCKVLLGVSEELPVYERRPATPYGEQEEQRIRAEQVSATEVEHLIRNDIAPLGSRPIANQLGRTREAQIHRIAESVRTDLAGFGIDSELINNVAEAVANEFLEEYAVRPDEGIEEIEPE